MGLEISIGEGKYFGLPYLIGRMEKEIFSYIRDRISKKTGLEGKVLVLSR